MSKIMGADVAGKTYRQALYLVTRPNFSVYIDHNDEIGEWLWSVVVTGTDFWLESFDTREEAIEWCAYNGWLTTHVNDRSADEPLR